MNWGRRTLPLHKNPTSNYRETFFRALFRRSLSFSSSKIWLKYARAPTYHRLGETSPMPIIISFETARFIAANPKAPSAQEFVPWLGEKLQSHGVILEGSHEKAGGTEFMATHGTAKYALRAESGGNAWKVSIDKRRKLSEQLLGKGQLAPTDPFVWLVENALQGEPDVTNVRRG